MAGWLRLLGRTAALPLPVEVELELAERESTKLVVDLLLPRRTIIISVHRVIDYVLTVDLLV